MAGRKEGADVIIEQIREELGPRYATLMDAIGWSVWAAEWRIDPTSEIQYYLGNSPENRAVRRALKEGYIPDETK